MCLIYISTPSHPNYAVISVNQVSGEEAEELGSPDFAYHWRNHGFGFARLGQHGSGFARYDLPSGTWEFLDAPAFPGRFTIVLTLGPRGIWQAIVPGQSGEGILPSGGGGYAGRITVLTAVSG